MERTEDNIEPVAASEEKCESSKFRRTLSPALLTEAWRKEYQNGHQSCRSYYSVCPASRKVPFSGDIFIGGSVLCDNKHQAKDLENQLRTTLRTQVQPFESLTSRSGILSITDSLSISVLVLRESSLKLLYSLC